MGTLKEEGKRQVTNTYDFLLEAMGLEESDGYYSFWDMLAAANREG